MAIVVSINQTYTSGSTSPATSGGFAKPAVGDLLVFTVETQSAGVTFAIPTDNSSGGNTWNVFPNAPLVGTTTHQIGIWYKVANAQDHANLTSVSVVITGTITQTNAAVTSWTGFTKTPTLDVTATGSGTAVTTLSYSGGAAQKVATEVAIAYIILDGIAWTVTGTNNYSPDGGTTTYALTTATANYASGGLVYAFPTTLGSSPRWLQTWTNSANPRMAAATFSDGPPPSGGNMLAVMGL